MNQRLVANVLLEYLGINDSNTLKRVLWINTPDDKAIVIILPTKGELPRLVSLSSLIDALERGEARILQQDPYINSGSPQELSIKNQTRTAKAWACINELISIGPTAMFDVTMRAEWIKNQTSQGQYTKPYLYQLLRRYWEGGQTRQALSPHYHRSGAKGQERLTKSDKKKGRPLNPWTNRPRPPGINIDETTKTLLQKGMVMFYESKAALSFEEAYRQTLEHFFKTGYEVLPSGLLKAVIPDIGFRPTLAQCKYWYKKMKSEVPANVARKGRGKYLLKSRAILGNSTKQAFGPGSQYQLDCTILDLNLISRINRTQLLGRPTLYVVTDTFSRMVVGFYVGLENASWRTALMALENVTADKAEFCRVLGIPGVTSQIWPTSHFPASIIADRGEFIGKKSDVLVEEFGVEVSNTPPYRPDWKPFVERQFGLINTRLIESLPGAVEKKERGSRDTRLDAVIDLPALRKFLALDFISYNSTARLNDYPMDLDMIADGVRQHPIDLWNWGLMNRTGAQKSFPQEMVRLSLLPREPAHVTGQGLRVKGLYFTEQILESLEWFSRARIHGVEDRVVSFDPFSNAEIVYLHASYDDEPELRESMTTVVRGIGFIPCRVIQHRGFEASVSWHELDQEAALRKELHQQDEPNQEYTQRSIKIEIDNIVAQQSEATKQALQEQGSISKRSRIKGIQQNRATEKATEREIYTAQRDQGTTQAIPKPTVDEVKTLFARSTSDDLNAAMVSAKARRSTKE